jgi:hypothetical protein
MGHGPRTGRGMGHCPDAVTADREPDYGYEGGGGYGQGLRPRFGRRGGRGRGRHARGWARESTPEESARLELAWLQGKEIRLQQGLDGIRARIEELQGRGGEDQV